MRKCLTALVLFEALVAFVLQGSCSGTLWHNWQAESEQTAAGTSQVAFCALSQSGALRFTLQLADRPTRRLIQPGRLALENVNSQQQHAQQGPKSSINFNRQSGKETLQRKQSMQDRLSRRVL